jgi:hypothetical protein
VIELVRYPIIRDVETLLGPVDGDERVMLFVGYPDSGYTAAERVAIWNRRGS